MPSSTASCTPRTALPSMARPCVNHRKNPPNVASLTPTPPSEPLKPSTGAAVRDHRNAVRDRSESLSAINRNTCPQSPESAVHMMISIPPKYAVSQVVGFIKGKSAIHLARVYGEKKRNFVGQHFWARGYF